MAEGTSSLHATVTRLAADPHARGDITILVTACHRMAIAYLRVKSAGGHFSPARFGLTLEDLAFDGIADLFTRDADGTFPVIRSFVERLGTPAGFSEAFAENSLRRFVCSLVNRRIFDLYRQFDPSLARIIRNIKIAALTHPDIRTAEYLGGKILTPRRSTDLNPRLPVIAPELLLSELEGRLEGQRSLRHLLSVLAEILDGQTMYKRLIPLSQAAVLIRSAMLPPDHSTEAGAEPMDLTETDVRRIVDEATQRLKHDKGPAYLRRGRLTDRELEAHISALRDLLLREFDGPESDHLCGYDSLRRHIAGLTHTEYVARHRSILEYLLRCARTHLAGNPDLGF